MRTAAGILMIIGALIGGSIWSTIVSELGVTRLVALLPMGLAVIGGIYALRRKEWRLALAGSICSVFVFPFLGIPAVILLIKRKGEFD